MAQSDKSLPTLASELWEMVVAYAKQETVDPLKRLGRFLRYGVPGALLFGTGLVLLAVGGLRALQTETGSRFTGNWSWAPYAILLVVSAGVAAWSARAVSANKRKGR
ncbi:MAG TPA: hypothetical protein VM938_00810 [Acidimicrobiales bacterium]|nr:hypothetical protein [Acidimicrobiales bacterium]